jgi:hypothetical protein
MVCESSVSGEHIVKNALSLKGNEAKKIEMSGKCGAYKVSVGIPEGKKYHLEGIRRDWRIILEWILNMLGRSGLA